MQKTSETPDTAQDFAPEDIRANDHSPSAEQSPGSYRTFKTQTDAVSFLVDYGFKVSGPTFSRAFKARKIPTNADGHFEEGALLAYANIHLDQAESLASREAERASAARLDADTDLKRYQAERQKLKLAKELGNVMPKAQYERDLASRALFFKNEVRTFIRLHGAAIIHLVGGNEDKLEALVGWWEDKTAIWMDAWSRDRTFVLAADAEEDNEDEEDAL